MATIGFAVPTHGGLDNLLWQATPTSPTTFTTTTNYHDYHNYHHNYHHYHNYNLLLASSPWT